MLYRFFFPLFCLQAPQGREVLAFCAAFVLWPAEWPSEKHEWAGGGAIGSVKCHSVSSTCVCFLFICRMRDMDTALSLSLSLAPLSQESAPLLLPTTFCPFCLCFPPLFSQLISSSTHMKAQQVCLLLLWAQGHLLCCKKKHRYLGLRQHFSLGLSCD